MKNVLKILYECVPLKPCEQHRIVIKGNASRANNLNLELAGSRVELIHLVLTESANKVFLIDYRPDTPAAVRRRADTKSASVRSDRL